jgi:hypothetical protein
MPKVLEINKTPSQEKYQKSILVIILGSFVLKLTSHRSVKKNPPSQNQKIFAPSNIHGQTTKGKSKIHTIKNFFHIISLLIIPSLVDDRLQERLILIKV